MAMNQESERINEARARASRIEAVSIEKISMNEKRHCSLQELIRGNSLAVAQEILFH